MSDKYVRVSRRDFLAGGIGAASAFWAMSKLATSPLVAAPARAESKLRFGLCTYSWGRDWDIPSLIANCAKAGLSGVELRSDMKYAHGVELTLSAAERKEVKKRFIDSPVRLVGIGTSEQLDWPEPDKLKAAIEATKAYLTLSHDVGCEIVRVFPNDFYPNVPHKKTIEQISQALRELAPFAADLGQELSVEAHGSVGTLRNMRAIMELVGQKNVRVRLNSDERDAQGKGFAANFALVKDFLSPIVHVRDLNDPQYPYQLMVDLLAKAGWDGWALSERQDKIPADRVAALAQQRKIWEGMVARSEAKR